MTDKTEQLDITSIRRACHELVEQARADELLQWSDRGLEIIPHDPEFVSWRALALNLLGRHVEAADTWARDPSPLNHAAIYLLRVGYCLMMTRHFERAISLLSDGWRMIVASGDTQSVECAEAERYLGEAMLKAGDSRGFAHWVMRNEQDGSYGPADIPVWNGESDLCGKRVLITHQLGFGDNFLLGACVRDWLDAGAKVMMTCDAQIHALMQVSLPECEVVSAPRPLQVREAFPDKVLARVKAFAPHMYVTLLHLPLLKTGQMTSGVPYHFSPYIHASHEKQQNAAEYMRWLRARHPGKKLVGLFWDCYQRHIPECNILMRCWAARRSVPLDAVNQLVTDAAIADKVHFINLHPSFAEKMAGTPVGNISHYLHGLRNFDDTAACIGQLDAVVSVDSSVANLAAMMGMTTCVLVNTSSDWRWGCDGTASPWISNVTVLHQTHEGDWDPVMRNLATWLKDGNLPLTECD